MKNSWKSLAHNSACLSLLCLLFSWLILCTITILGNSTHISENAALNSYWWRLITLSSFLISLTAAILLMNNAQSVSKLQKCAYTVFALLHYCALLSLVLLDGGNDIPLAQVGAFILSGIALFMFGCHAVARVIQPKKDATE